MDSGEGVVDPHKLCPARTQPGEAAHGMLTQEFSKVCKWPPSKLPLSSFLPPFSGPLFPPKWLFFFYFCSRWFVIWPSWSVIMLAIGKQILDFSITATSWQPVFFPAFCAQMSLWWLGKNSDRIKCRISSFLKCSYDYGYSLTTQFVLDFIFWLLPDDFGFLQVTVVQGTVYYELLLQVLWSDTR